MLARVRCVEVRCDMPLSWRSTWEQNDPDEGYEGSGKSRAQEANMRRQRRKLLCALNPNKINVCAALLQHHTARGDRVLIFAQQVRVLHELALWLGCPVMSGRGTMKAGSNGERVARVGTSLAMLPKEHGDEHKALLNIMKEGHHAGTQRPETAASAGAGEGVVAWLEPSSASGTVLLFSSMGNTSIDLPDVNVVMQISGHELSRMEETQRIGRVMRRKRNTAPVLMPAETADSYGPTDKGGSAMLYNLITPHELETKEKADDSAREWRRSFIVEEGVEVQSFQYNDPTFLPLEKLAKANLVPERMASRLLTAIQTVGEVAADEAQGGGRDDSADCATAAAGAARRESPSKKLKFGGRLRPKSVLPGDIHAADCAIWESNDRGHGTRAGPGKAKSKGKAAGEKCSCKGRKKARKCSTSSCKF